MFQNTKPCSSQSKIFKRLRVEKIIYDNKQQINFSISLFFMFRLKRKKNHMLLKCNIIYSDELLEHSRMEEFRNI